MPTHARLSPSGADRWMTCSASVKLIELLIERGELRESDMEGEVSEQITEDEIIEQQLYRYEDAVLDPTRESTTFSAEGTVLHDVRANCLALDLDPHNFVGQTFSADGFSFEIDEDMADRLVPGIDWIRERTHSPAIERRVNLSEWLPGNYGFCDTYWLMPVARKKDLFDLYVNDYKNGVGEPVPAIGTRQLRLYALGAWVELGKPNIRNVVLVIDQPRAGGIKDWTISFDELMEFADEVRRVYERIQSGNVEFVPTTKGCRWCPVRKTKRGCAAFNQWKIQMIGAPIMDMSVDEPRYTDPAQMSRAMRYYIVKNAAGIRAWLAKLHDESLQAAIEGDPDPGSKAIEGSGRRFFTDPDKAQEIVSGALGDAAFKPKALIGFTEIDKLMKPGTKKKGHPQAYAELLKVVDTTEAKAKLVPADHPAPAYTRAAEDDFEDQITDAVEDDFEEV
jgi:hypothetical protein